MKIGLVRRGFSATGGAEAYLLRLARGLEQAGHEPVLITTDAWPADRWPNSSIRRLPGKTPAHFAAAVERATLEVDIIYSLERVPGCHVYRAGDGVHAAWLHRRSRFEPAWKRFFHLINPKHLSLLRLECELYQRVHSVIANSHMVAEEIIRWQEFPKERVHVIPNGISTFIDTIPQEEARRRLEVPANAFCVLFAGTGWERKGLRFAIQAVEAMAENTLLLVAGRGPSPRHSSSRVRFLGPVADLSALFSAADVFTLPTIYDPFSNACLEALAAGLPVVTTSANGFSEIITPGQHGDIIEPGNVTALRRALTSWRGHTDADTAAACRTLASNYTIERNVTSTLEVLTAIAA